MSQINVNVLLVRAFKTFVQGFASAVTLNIANVTNLSTAKVLLIGAEAAGISALMNLFIAPTEAK